MFLNKSSFLPRYRWAAPAALGALLLTSSALCLTGCGGSKPADAPNPNNGLAHTKEQDQEISKEAVQEKHLDGGGGAPTAGAGGSGALAPEGGK